MATFNNGAFIGMILNRIEPLAPDNYVFAFGREGRHFFTPNGYAANYLPSSVFTELSTIYRDNRVVWASFGDTPDSWFFAYLAYNVASQAYNGTVTIRLGPGAPHTLREYIEQVGSNSKERLGPVRVVLGSNGSFLVWAKSAWACRNVPETLLSRLIKWSSSTRIRDGMTMGSLLDSTLANVAWHPDGSCFVRAENHRIGWVFRSGTTRAAWDKIWAEVGVPGPGLDELSELCYVAMDSHAPTSDTFAFMKKQKYGEEAPFILHFGQEPVHTRLSRGDRRVQMAPQTEDGHFRWAISTRSGRPHEDDWELELKKGQRVRVLRDMGKGWYLVEGKKGVKGWVHKSWLDFSEARYLENPRSAWVRFSADLAKMMKSALVEDFLTMADYVDSCALAGCMPAKNVDSLSLGVCAHDLRLLLGGSPSFSKAFVKNWRNQFHPDRFCAPEHGERLKAMAEQLFVLAGVVMEMA